MRALRLVPEKTTFRFMRWRTFNFTASIAATIISLILVAVLGLNFGIDFRGGTLIEIKTTDGPADIAQIRELVGGLDLGDVQIQEFGSPDDVLIRVEQQDGGELAQQAVIEKVKSALGDTVEYRRVEIVGPQVSGELVQSGAIAVVSALLAILIYIWFRFEWQFGVGALFALVHDVSLTFGFFSLTRLEFDLNSVAAVLTIIGYSLNDTIVVYDRVRENLRKYRKMEIVPLLDLSVNETLARTIMTSLTMIIALTCLLFWGPEVIFGFTAAMLLGIFIGTYSSIYMAAPILVWLKVGPDSFIPKEAAVASGAERVRADGAQP